MSKHKQFIDEYEEFRAADAVPSSKERRRIEDAAIEAHRIRSCNFRNVRGNDRAICGFTGEPCDGVCDLWGTQI